jgi:hypothetical protein
VSFHTPDAQNQDYFKLITCSFLFLNGHLG